MALKPKSETVGAVYDVFVKVFELLTGGFSISPDGFNKDVKLPKGSLLKVDEDTRTATPIKTSELATASTEPTNVTVLDGHHFQVGDDISIGNGTASEITAVDGNKLTVAAFGTGAKGTVVYETADSGTSEADRAIKDVPNGILRYDTTIATGEFATVAIRGTVYKNRIQAHIDGHLDDLSHIHFSESK